MGKRNPNNYGCVTKLKGKRSRPWIVKVTVYDSEGRARQVPVDYAETEEQANIILAQYNNNPWNIDRNKVTLLELYRRWSEVQLSKLGKSTQSSSKTAFNHCQKYYGMKYRSLRAYHMQDCINNCGRGYGVQSQIRTLWRHLDRFAFECDIIEKMYSQIVTTSTEAPETTRSPFTPEQIAALWDIQDQPYVDTVLVFIYTGFRLTELLDMKTEQVDLEQRTFKGGIKTTAGKGRIVPIHPRIYPFVENWVRQGHKYLILFDGIKIKARSYYPRWNEVMHRIGASGKTPHEARHTFETMLDNAQGNRKCIDMLMGHKSPDIGNRVYNHKTLDQLRETILLLK